MPDPTPSPSRQPETDLPPLDLRILPGPTPGPRDLRWWVIGILVMFVLAALAAPYLREAPRNEPPPSPEGPRPP